MIYRNTLTIEKLTVGVAGSDLESLWIQIVNRRPIIVGVVCRPPSAVVTPSLLGLGHQLTQVLAKNKPVYLLGDTNFDLLSPDKPGVAAYRQLLSDYSLSQLIDAPTHPDPTPTLLDHLVTSTPDLTSRARVIASDISDHDMITAQVRGIRVRRRPTEITVRSTREASVLTRLNWTCCRRTGPPYKKRPTPTRRSTGSWQCGDATLTSICH